MGEEGNVRQGWLWSALPLCDPLQKLIKLPIEPFEGRWFGRLVVGMRELLDRDLMKVPSHDLFRQVVFQYIIID